MSGVDGIEDGSRELIYIEGVFEVTGWTVRALVDKVQDGGHRVKARWEEVQSSSGLCALSQSVPRMISWEPTLVT